GQGQSVVTAVTRSGSNDFHGSVYEFLRNDNLDARHFFDARKPEFRRNQYGATQGGPIVRNRVFFFGAFEGLREAQGRTLFGTVPDPKLLTGDLSSIAPTIIDPSTGQAFVGNQIPDNRISRFAKGYAKYFPGPNNPGSNNYRRVANFLDSSDS